MFFCQGVFALTFTVFPLVALSFFTPVCGKLLSGLPLKFLYAVKKMNLSPLVFYQKIEDTVMPTIINLTVTTGKVLAFSRKTSLPVLLNCMKLLT